MQCLCQLEDNRTQSICWDCQESLIKQSEICLNIYLHIRSSKFFFHAIYLSSTGLFHLKRFFSYSIYRVSQKNAILTLEANISGLKAHLGESRTSFENCMFSAFIWPLKQVNSIPASLRKTGFKKLT